MKLTTLCYISRGEEVLLLRRAAWKTDGSAGKWQGVGGRLEPGETPRRCLLREVEEETGLRLAEASLRGVVDFRSDCFESERMFLYTARSPEGQSARESCPEGELSYVRWEDVPTLPAWEGDRVFLDLLRRGAPFFRLTLIYRGERLSRALLGGENLPLREG